MIDLATDNFELDITRAHTIVGREPNAQCVTRYRK